MHKMKVLLFLCLVCTVANASPSQQRCGDSACPTPEPPGPTVRCPDCVNSKCTTNMCNWASFVPYPGDCSKYCVCDSLGAIQMSCPDGLVFDPSLNVCVWPASSTCQNSDAYPECDVPEEPNPSEQCPPCVNALCTPDMCNLAKGVNFPGDCTRFCMCTNSGPIAMDCPEGLVFEVSLGVCVWPAESNCKNSDVIPGC
ncbi:hypothetical protein B566_EDAN002253 [Ephemera danica]|nr:hypothetical protein B566_EDAN002253 [Ephemera danica]